MCSYRKIPSFEHIIFNIIKANNLEKGNYNVSGLVYIFTAAIVEVCKRNSKV